MSGQQLSHEIGGVGFDDVDYTINICSRGRVYNINMVMMMMVSGDRHLETSLNKEDVLRNPGGSFGTLGGSRHPLRLLIGCPWATLGTAGPLQGYSRPLGCPSGRLLGPPGTPSGNLRRALEGSLGLPGG